MLSPLSVAAYMQILLRPATQVIIKGQSNAIISIFQVVHYRGSVLECQMAFPSACHDGQNDYAEIPARESIERDPGPLFETGKPRSPKKT